MVLEGLIPSDDGNSPMAICGLQVHLLIQQVLLSTCCGSDRMVGPRDIDRNGPCLSGAYSLLEKAGNQVNTWT